MDTMTEVNCTTGETIIRDLTEPEIVQRKIDADAEIARLKDKAQVEAASEAARTAAVAKLAALGLTTDDLKALGL